MSEKLMCHNCGRFHGPIRECVIGAMANALQDRIGLPIPAEFIGRFDANDLWDRFLGPALDHMEDAWDKFAYVRYDESYAGEGE